MSFQDTMDSRRLGSRFRHSRGRRESSRRDEIIEFQGDHFAGPQSQAGQQANDGAITAGDGRVPLASMDDPLDFFWLEVLQQPQALSHGSSGTER
jgi:hypothetical protein